MKIKHIMKGSAFLSTVLLCQTASALVIDSSSTDGDALAAIIMGSGITVSNVNYFGDDNQSGAFSDGGSVLGINSGLIMTTGSVFDAPGPNVSDSTSTNTSASGDSDLNALIPQSTNDAAVLEFDFETTSGDLFFNYSFASEEYNEYVGSSFNDVFAFFVNGSNIALAPDGQPVSINNVNCSSSGTGTGPNCDVYNDNDLSNGTPSYNIAYDGFTDKLTASITGLGAGIHHMKIAIADAGDSSLDSAVFIEGGSFSSTPVPEPGALALVALGMGGLVARRRQKRA